MESSTHVQTVVVVGYLGAGKTSMLRSLQREVAAAEGPARLRTIVNDAAPFNVDARLLAGDTPLPAADAASRAAPVDLTGGCICCTLLPEFLAAAAAEVRALAAGGWLFVESTGLGDAGPIVAGLLGLPEFASDGRGRVSAVVGVLDVTVAARLQGDPVSELLLEQLRWCTTIVLTRINEATPVELAAARALVDKAIPTDASSWQRDRPTIVPGDFGRVRLSQIVRHAPADGCVHGAAFMAAWAEELLASGGEHESEIAKYGFRTVVIAAAVGSGFDEDALIAAAAADGGLLEGVSRSKGFVMLRPAPGAVFGQHVWAGCGRALCYAPQAADKRFCASRLPEDAIVLRAEGSATATPTDAAAFDTVLIFIGRAVDRERLREQLGVLLQAVPA
jgi:G3E family GTPase